MPRTSLPSLLLLCLLTLPAASFAAPPDHWVGTWAASPVSGANTDGKYGAADTTYREIVHTSLGGNKVRIILTNEFGTEPLTIAAARVALSAGGSDITPTADRELAFGGRPAISIPAGALALSDPVDLKLPAGANLAISIFLPAQTIQHVSLHTFANQTSYTASGNVTSAAKLESPTEIINWPFLKGVNVLAGGNSSAIVAFGDSITDGAHSTLSANARWPDVLAKRLQADKKTADIAVLNEGIGGNRVLHDVAGPNALARFDRDVLSQAGVKYLIILESINDIGHATRTANPDDVVSADELIQGLAQMAERAHQHGIKVYGATLTPYMGAGYAYPAGEAMRQAINHWIKTTNQFDGFIDFDKATQDPANPATFAAADDSGDHLHPSDAGYKAMGDSIDLKLFTK